MPGSLSQIKAESVQYYVLKLYRFHKSWQALCTAVPAPSTSTSKFMELFLGKQVNLNSLEGSKPDNLTSAQIVNMMR